MKARQDSKASASSAASQGHMSKECRSKETNAFEVVEEEPSEHGCLDMASIELNALDVGSVQVSEEHRKIRIGFGSCAAVTVFPKVAEYSTVLKTPGKAKSNRPAWCKLLPDFGARKVQVKLKDGSFRCVNQRAADTHRALVAVSEMNDMGHDVFFPGSDTGIKEYAYHEGSDTKLELARVNGVFELPVKLVPYKQSSSKSSNTGPHSSLSAMQQIGNLMDKFAKTEHSK